MSLKTLKRLGSQGGGEECCKVWQPCGRLWRSRVSLSFEVGESCDGEDETDEFPNAFDRVPVPRLVGESTLSSIC